MKDLCADTTTTSGAKKIVDKVSMSLLAKIQKFKKKVLALAEEKHLLKEEIRRQEELRETLEAEIRRQKQLNIELERKIHAQDQEENELKLKVENLNTLLAQIKRNRNLRWMLAEHYRNQAVKVMSAVKWLREEPESGEKKLKIGRRNIKI